MNVRSWQNIRVIQMRNVWILTDLLDAHAEKGITVMVIRAQVGFCPEINFFTYVAQLLVLLLSFI